MEALLMSNWVIYFFHSLEKWKCRIVVQLQKNTTRWLQKDLSISSSFRNCFTENLCTSDRYELWNLFTADVIVEKLMQSPFR